MNRSSGNEGKGERAVKFATAITVIGPMAVTWATGIVVTLSVLLLYPRLPSGSRYTTILVVWAALIPVLSLVSAAGIFLLFRVMLWSVSDAGEKRERDKRGRFIKVNGGGKKKSRYVVVVDENGEAVR